MNALRPDDSGPVKLDYASIEKSAKFLELQRRHRRFVFPLAAFFLAWYFGFVLFAAYAPDLMAIPVVGSINLGLVLGLLQFATTFTITMWYVSFANRKLDPLGAELRHDLEQAELLAEATRLEGVELERTDKP